MTLNWSETAGDCRIAEALVPAILEHFTYDPYLFTWNKIGGGLTKRQASRQVLDYIADLPIPAGPAWDRTRRLMLTAQGLYRLKRIVEYYLRGIELGRSCSCYSSCNYPALRD